MAKSDVLHPPAAGIPVLNSDLHERLVDRVSVALARHRTIPANDEDEPSAGEAQQTVGPRILDLLTRTKRIERHLRLAGQRWPISTVVHLTADAARALESVDDDAMPGEPTWSQPTLLLLDHPYPRMAVTDRGVHSVLRAVNRCPALEVPVSAVLTTGHETFAVVDDHLVAYLDEPWIERLDRAVAEFRVLVTGVHPTTAPERKAVRKAGASLERIDIPRIGDVRQPSPPRIHHRSCHRADGRAKLSLRSEDEARAVCDRFRGRLRWYRCDCGFFHTASASTLQAS